MAKSEQRGLLIAGSLIAGFIALLFYWSISGEGYASSGCNREKTENPSTDTASCRHGSYHGGRYFSPASWFYRNDVSTYSEPSNRSGSVGGVNRVAGGPGYGK